MRCPNAGYRLIVCSLARNGFGIDNAWLLRTTKNENDSQPSMISDR